MSENLPPIAPGTSGTPGTAELERSAQESAHFVYVPLSQGKVAKVSREDAERVLEHKWSATRTRSGHWYAKRKVFRGGKYTSEMLHRFIMDAPKGMDVDHRNGDGLDNTRGNLRVATRSQNNANQIRPPKRQTSSRYRGVIWAKDKGRWRVTVCCEGLRFNVGYFDDELEAARAYEAKHRDLFGEFSRPQKLALEQ